MLNTSMIPEALSQASVTDVVSEVKAHDSSPSMTAYSGLANSARIGAESLTSICHGTNVHADAAKQLSNRSFLQSITTSLPLAIVDFVAMWLIFFLATSVCERLLLLPHDLITSKSALFASFLLLPLAELAGVYPALGISPVVEFRQLVRAAAIALTAFFVMGCFLHPNYAFFYFCSAALAMLCAVPILPAVRFCARTLLARTSFWGAPILIFAEPQQAFDLFRRLKSMRDRGLRPVGVLLNPEDYWARESSGRDPAIPTYDARDALNCAVAAHATWVLIGTKEAALDAVEQVIDESLCAIPHRVYITAAGPELGLWDRACSIGTECGFMVSGVRPNAACAIAKRCFDLLSAGVALVLGAPFLLSLCLAVKFTSRGPVFFGQKRVGLNGESFTAWKFRTMHVDAEEQLHAYLDSNPAYQREWQTTRKLKVDPRITSIGRFLRKTSLDELPQLWNILKGDMSLVGPRPIIASSTYDGDYIEKYPREFGAYKTMRPGLTGLWQVTCRNSGVYEMRIYWDMYYLRNWSLWLDIYIVLRTVRTVLLREGAY